MGINMQQLIGKIEKYLDTLTRRDQISLAIIVVVTLASVWFLLVYAPLSESGVRLQQDLEKKKNELVVVQAKMSALQASLKNDPDRENRAELARYVEDNKRLDQALAKTTSQIISPQEMVELLERMLETQSGLEFISLKNKPATPEFVESHKEGDAVVENVSTIYRHSVVLQVEGSYHNVLAYIKKLEQFPWRFFWEKIEIETRKYPKALVTLEVYTLGFREGLIGV